MNDFPSKYKNNSKESTGFLFIKAYNNWHSEIKKRLKSIDITHPQYVVLATLGYLKQNYDEVTQVMISAFADMDVMTVSEIIKVLERKKFITRKNHTKDTRAKSLFINENGTETLSKALRIVEDIDAVFFGSLKKDEAFFKKNLTALNNYKFSDK